MAKSKRQDASEAALPVLDESTMSVLTKRIESKLQAPKTSNPPKDVSSKPANPKSKAPILEGHNRGKKRAHTGEVVHKPSNPNATGAVGDLDALRTEIIALGGTEEDLALVAELESGSEVENEVPMSKTARQFTKKEDNLRDDVAKMLKTMGVEKSRAAATTAESEEDLQTEEEEETEADGVDDVEDGVSRLKEAAQQVAPIDRKSSSKLLVTPQAEWFNIPLPDVTSGASNNRRVQIQVVQSIQQYSEELLEAENAAYQANQKSASSSQKFYATVINSGTLTDKISALTLAVQESPLHNVKGLENLLGLAKKRSRAQAIDVLRALKDLFAQGSLLPSDRRLKTFATQPGIISTLAGVSSWSSGQPLPKGLRPQQLILWAYEHWLKGVYFEVLTILESWCNDELEYSKARALSYVYELIKEKPEQESNLLRLLVNKLGDRAKKIASRASYLLLELQSAHPLMKDTIISAIEGDLVWRPGQTLHAKYYAVITLNQTVLSAKEETVASKLLDVYFGLFVTVLKPNDHKVSTVPQTSDSNPGKKWSSKPQSGKGSLQDDELREKLTSAILTGINRAYPYVVAEREKVTQHMDTLFRITHSANFNTSIQAMLLIQQLTISNQMSSDRFYRTLYESLLDPRLVTSSKQSLYLNLLFRSLKADVNVKRVKAFVKRVLQIIGLHQASFVVGVFHLLKELEVTFPSLKALLDQPEEHDIEQEHFRDVDEGEQSGVAGQGAEDTTNADMLYDGKKRDPEHSNADRSCLWELLPWLAHYHPSVSVAASSIVSHTPLSGKPDLNLYTLIHFLDRFVYRNPKASASAAVRGASVMQPTLAGDPSLSLFSISANQQLPVNSESFWKREAEDIAADDVFFHQYFSSIGKDKLAKKQSKTVSAEEDNEEDAIWKAITDSRPEVERADESDDDLDMDDLESDFEDSDPEIFDDLDDEDEDEDLLDPDMGEEDGSGVDFVGFDENESDDEDVDTAFEAESTALEEASEKRRKDRPAKEQKRKIKALPIFASADDYATMLDDDRGEDIG